MCKCLKHLALGMPQDSHRFALNTHLNKEFTPKLEAKLIIIVVSARGGLPFPLRLITTGLKRKL